MCAGVGCHDSRMLGRNLGAGVVVVLDLRAEREVHGRRELDAVLHEDVRPVQPLVRRQERLRRRVHDAVVRLAEAAADQDLVRAEREAVLPLDVERVEMLLELLRMLAVRVVPVRLHARHRPAGELARPAADEVGAVDLALAGVLVDLATVRVALHGERVDRPVPVGTESDLPALGRVPDRAAPLDRRVVEVEVLRVHAVAAAPRQRAAVAHRRARLRVAGAADTSKPCVLSALRVMMLMTPLTALAPQRVAPGPLTTSIRSMSSSTTSCASQNTPEKSGV
jgi:hypothetical protein